jgi:regulator of sigma E protease
VLDGGQLVMIAIEKIKGSPVSESFLEYSFRLGILLIGSLMIFAVFNDIARVI